MNVTMGNSTEHSMGQLLSDHQTALTSVIIVSLILGLPLTLHMLWHLQVNDMMTHCVPVQSQRNPKIIAANVSTEFGIRVDGLSRLSYISVNIL